MKTEKYEHFCVDIQNCDQAKGQDQQNENNCSFCI